jgi:hypothetical protein
MAYTKEEKRQVRTAFLRMMLRIRNKLDDARIALILSVADLYFDPVIVEDEMILAELSNEFPKEANALLE